MPFLILPSRWITLPKGYTVSRPPVYRRVSQFGNSLQRVNSSEVEQAPLTDLISNLPETVYPLGPILLEGGRLLVCYPQDSER